MPDGAEVAIHKIIGIALTGFRTGTEHYLKRHRFYLVESLNCFHALVVLVPGLERATFAHTERFGVLLSLTAIHVVHNDAVFLRRGQRNLAHTVAADADGHFAGTADTNLGIKITGYYRTNDETEVIRTGKGTVFVERSALSATVAAQTCYLRVEMKVCAARLGQLVGMGSKEQFFLRPRQCTGAHLAVCHEANTVAFHIRYGTPAHVFAVALCLWFGQHDTHLAHGAAVLLDERTSEAVIIVILRTATIVGEAVVFRRQFKGIAYAGQHHVALVRRYGAAEFDRAVGIDGIDFVRHKLEVVGTKCGCIIHELVSAARTATQLCAAGCLTRYGEGNDDLTVLALEHLGIGGFVLQVMQTFLCPCVPRPVVVVHYCTESIEFRSAAGFDDSVAAVRQCANRAIGFTELNFETLTAYSNDITGFNSSNLVVLRLLHFECGQQGIVLQEELFFHLHIALLCPRLVCLEQELHLYEVLCIGSKFREIERQSVTLMFARLERQRSTCKGLFIHFPAVLP